MDSDPGVQRSADPDSNFLYTWGHTVPYLLFNNLPMQNTTGTEIIYCSFNCGSLEYWFFIYILVKFYEAFDGLILVHAW